MSKKSARERDFARALEYVKRIDHPNETNDEGIEREKVTARKKLAEVVEKWGFTEEELRPPVEPPIDLEEEALIDQRIAFDNVLQTLGVTREQVSGFVGRLAVEGLTKVVGYIFSPRKK